MKLYKILKLHVPDGHEGMEGLDFISAIMESITDKGRYNDYIKALEVLLDEPFEKIYDKIEPEQAMETFSLGLLNNRFMDLYSFCSKIGL